jgi:hypothetical protein
MDANAPEEKSEYASGDRSCRGGFRGYVASMSITLEVDEEALRALPLELGERERHMQIELAASAAIPSGQPCGRLSR